VRDYVGSAKLIYDLFCGVGTFTLPLARKARVMAFDSEKPSIECLDRAARFNEGLKPIVAKARDLYRAPLTPDEFGAADTVVLDPPRAGCEAQVRHLSASKVSVIAAVSCDPGTFARDARILIDGGFKLETVQVIDQFVWSPHIELVARFSRKPPPKHHRI
jgi:23S rRNA (uracil1939-C5)-methyltransferase